MPLHLLITGGAGEIGSRLARRLVRRGHRVRVLALPGDQSAGNLHGSGCELVRGDVTRPESLPDALAGAHTVYHLAAVLLVEREELFQRVNVQGTRNMVQAAEAAGVGHFIHVSSASVVYPRATPYSRSKRAGEAVVCGSSVPWTIVRPTLVYDAQGGLEFRTFAQFVCRYPVVPLVGRGAAVKNPVHADDLVDGLAAICGEPRTHRRRYDLCGGGEITVAELAALVLQRRGLSRPLLPVPVPVWRLAARIWGPLTGREMLLGHTLAGLTQDAALDCSEARRDLGYNPRDIRQGLLQEAAEPRSS